MIPEWAGIIPEWAGIIPEWTGMDQNELESSGLSENREFKRFRSTLGS